MDDDLKLKYHDSLNEYYNSDEKRLIREKAVKSERIYDSMGYYAGKFVSGYIVGYVIGVILAFWFIWYFIVDPWVIPIVKIILGG
jgi:ABC-type nitrate/sulfonate/bicarbonate transport system permease component